MIGPLSSEAAFCAVVSRLPEPALLAHATGQLRFANAPAAHLLASTPEELQGRELASLVASPPERVARFLRAASRTAAPVFGTVALTRGNDEPLDCRCEGSVLIPAEAGTPALVLIRLIRKETATRRFLALNLRHEELVREVQRRRDAEAALRAADRRKDEFLATLAHELRNPLAAIRNSVTLMGMVGPLPGRAEDARQIVERQVGHLTRLVDDLLEVSRITQGKLQLRRERISLLVPIREALEAVQPAADAAWHQLHVVLPRDPLYADADATRMTQVVLNLLTNAVKFTARGGHIWLSAERDGEHGVLSVRDTGAGIAAEHLDTIFEMFSQPTPPLERTESGLGIGLALVRGLVELHGGVVRASSPGPGKGSEFVVRLPLARAADQDRIPAREKGAGKVKTAGKRILVVDDNLDAARSLRQLLELSGHEVREAHDGIEAIHAAGAFRPHIVFLDIGMPRMNGYEAAREIRRQANGSPMRIVAVTGWGQEGDRRLAEEAGFDLHLTKPVELALLEKLLRE